MRFVALSSALLDGEKVRPGAIVRMARNDSSLEPGISPLFSGLPAVVHTLFRP
jgi:hypothetical protein